MKFLKHFLVIFFLITLLSLNADINNWEYKGASISSYYSKGFNNIYVYETIDYLQSLGFNSIAIVTTWYQDDFESNHIYSNDEKTIDDKDLIKIIQYCHKKGLSVNLKPHLDPFPYSEEQKWRAEINPTDVDKWFKEFENFILHYTKIAVENNIEIYTIGTEMISMANIKYIDYWKELIKKVREAGYTGQISYAAHQFETFGNKAYGCEMTSREFWDLFDIISLTTYYTSYLKWNIIPDYKMLHKEWVIWKKSLEKWKKKINLDKKVILGEGGYRSIDFTHKAPWQTDGEIKKGFNNFNEDLQAICYQSMMDIINDISWLDGIYIWQEKIESPPTFFNRENTTYSIINKKASQVFKNCFIKNDNTEYKKIEINRNEISGDWYYMNDKDMAGTSKIIIDNKETEIFSFIIKKIDGKFKEIAPLYGLVTTNSEDAYIGMGVNLNEMSLNVLKDAKGIKFKATTNLDEIDIFLETGKGYENNYFKKIKLDKNKTNEITINFEDFEKIKKDNTDLNKLEIKDISFLTTKKPIKNVQLEIFDLDFIK